MWRAALLLVLTAAFFVELDEFLADRQEAGGAARKAYAAHGPVRKKDLARWLAFLEIPIKGAEDLSKTFEEFDEDGDGTISFAEMVTEMKNRVEDKSFLNTDKVKQDPETASPVQVDPSTDAKISQLLSRGGEGDVSELDDLIQISSNHKIAVFNAAVLVARDPPRIESLPEGADSFIVAETPRGGTEDDVGKTFRVTRWGNKKRTVCESIRLDKKKKKTIKLTVDFSLDKCYNPMVIYNAMNVLSIIVRGLPHDDETPLETKVWVGPFVQLLGTRYKSPNIAGEVHWHVLSALDREDVNLSDLDKKKAIAALNNILEVYKGEGYKNYAEDVVVPAKAVLAKLGAAPAEE